MPVFKPFGTLSPTVDGKAVDFTDGSNYDNNDDGVTLNNLLSRSIMIKDANAVTIASAVLQPGQTVVDIPIPKDLYLEVILSWVKADNTTVTNSFVFLFEQNYKLQFIASVKKLDCNCKGGKSLCDNTIKAIMSEYAAGFHVYIDPANAQKEIIAANLYLSNSDCRC